MTLTNIQLRDLFFLNKTIDGRFKIVYRGEWKDNHWNSKWEEQEVIFFDRIDKKYYKYCYERKMFNGKYKYQPISFGNENNKHYIMETDKPRLKEKEKKSV